MSKLKNYAAMMLQPYLISDTASIVALYISNDKDEVIDWILEWTVLHPKFTKDLKITDILRYRSRISIGNDFDYVDLYIFDNLEMGMCNQNIAPSRHKVNRANVGNVYKDIRSWGFFTIPALVSKLMNALINDYETYTESITDLSS